MLAKTFQVTILVFLSTIVSINQTIAQDVFPELAGPYLGQETPDLIPKVFAPGIVSINGRHEYGISFSASLDEVYFSTQKEGGVASIYGSKIEKGKWQPIKKIKLTKGKKAGEMHPFVSLDGDRLYFTAYNADFTDTKIWYANRTDDGWNNAVKLDALLNQEEVFYSTLANNGDLFYTDIFKSKTFYSPFEEGNYSTIEEVEIEYGLHPFISSTKDFLLVDAVANDQGRKDKDIYVYFRNTDGTWTDPINLGRAVNSDFYETVPSVTPDGKYLFFSRYDEEGGFLSNLYWVSTKVIESLRPQL